MTYNLSTCTSNADCHPYQTNRLCMAGATWLKPDEDECQCGSFFGRIGEKCDELTFGSVASILLYTLIGVASLGFSIHASQLLRLRLRHRPTVPRRKSRRVSSAPSGGGIIPLRILFSGRRPVGRNLNAADTTLMLFILTELSCVVVAGLTVANFVVTSGVPPKWLQEGNDARFQGVLRIIAYPAFGTFTTIFQFHMCLMWIDVAELVLGDNQTESTGLSFFRRNVVRTEVVLVATHLSSMALQPTVGLNLLPAVAFLTTLINIALYTIGARKLDKCAKLMASADASVRFSINELRDDVVSTVNYARAGNTACAVASVVFLATATSKEFKQPGQFFHAVRISHHLIFLSLNIVHAFLYRFMHLRLSRRINRKVGRRARQSVSPTPGGGAKSSNSKTPTRSHGLFGSVSCSE